MQPVFGAVPTSDHFPVVKAEVNGSYFDDRSPVNVPLKRRALNVPVTTLPANWLVLQSSLPLSVAWSLMKLRLDHVQVPAVRLPLPVQQLELQLSDVLRVPGENNRYLVSTTTGSSRAVCRW